MSESGLRFLASLLLACTAPAQAAVYRIAHGTEPYMADDMGQAVLTEAYRRLGHTLNLERYPLERGLLLANAGEVDGDLVRGQTGLEQQYPELQRIPTSIANDEFVVYGRDKKITPAGWESLAPYRLAGLRTTKLQQLSRTYDIIFVKSQDQGLQMLREGRVDFFVKLRGTHCYIIQHDSYGAILQEPGIEQVLFYQYFNTRHAELAAQLDTTLRQMEEDGSLKRIQDEVRRRWLDCSTAPIVK